MGVVFHFYDSEEGESDDEDVIPARGRMSRRTMSSKQTQEQRSVQDGHASLPLSFTMVLVGHTHFFLLVVVSVLVCELGIIEQWQSKEAKRGPSVCLMRTLSLSLSLSLTLSRGKRFAGTNSSLLVDSV